MFTVSKVSPMLSPPPLWSKFIPISGALPWLFSLPETLFFVIPLWPITPGEFQVRSITDGFVTGVFQAPIHVKWGQFFKNEASTSCSPVVLPLVALGLRGGWAPLFIKVTTELEVGVRQGKVKMPQSLLFLPRFSCFFSKKKNKVKQKQNTLFALLKALVNF